MATPRTGRLFNLDALFDDLNELVPRVIEDVEDFTDKLITQTNRNSLLGDIFDFVEDVSNIRLPNFTLPKLPRLDFPSLNFGDGLSNVVDDVFNFAEDIIEQTTEIVDSFQDIDIPFLEDLDSNSVKNFFDDVSEIADSIVGDALGDGVNLITDQIMELSIGDRILEVSEAVQDIANDLLTSNLFDEFQDAVDSLPSLKVTLTASVDPRRGSTGGNEARQLVLTASISPDELGLNAGAELRTISAVL